MTRYTVVWHDSALDELVQLWLGAADRRSISNASDAVDRELAQDAAEKGMTVDESLRELVSPPIRIIFSVSEPDRLVKVTSVALI